MAFSRFHDDPSRQIKQLQQSTGPGRYMLNVPGNGETPSFMEDPHIIAQKWGGNLWTNTVQLESDLFGITRNLGKDCLGKDEYSRTQIQSSPAVYPNNKSLATEQSRAIMPAWTARDLEQDHRYYLPLDPQENVCFRFENNLSTRILEKDHFNRNDAPFRNNFE